MRVVRPKQIAEVARFTTDEIVPIIVLEPLAAADPKKERDQRRQENAVGDNHPTDSCAALARTDRVQVFGPRLPTHASRPGRYAAVVAQQDNHPRGRARASLRTSEHSA